MKKTRIKIFNSPKLSSNMWVYRHLNDQYVQKANKDGYKSRSAYKLIEIDNKFKLFHNGQKVIDFGAYPGGWSQVASKRGTSVVAVDIKRLNRNIFDQVVECIECDINDIYGILINKKFKDQKFDVILSDMSPKISGIKSLDHVRIMLLSELALKFAKHFLNYGGKFIVKIFQGESDKDYFNKLKTLFKVTKYFKPKSSRCESAEIYLVNLDFFGVVK